MIERNRFQKIEDDDESEDEAALTNKTRTSVHLYAHTKRLAETVEVLRIHLNAERLSSLCIVKRLCFAAGALIKVRSIEIEGAGARADLNGAVELRLRLR